MTYKGTLKGQKGSALVHKQVYNLKSHFVFVFIYIYIRAVIRVYLYEINSSINTKNGKEKENSY